MTASTSSRVRRLDHAEWTELASARRDFSYQQTVAFNRALAARDRARLELVVIDDDRFDIAGLAAVRVHSVPMIGGGVAYVSAGPVTRLDDPDDMERLERSLHALRTEYTERRGLVLRILAPVGSPAWNESAAPVFARAGFAPASRGRRYRTLLLDARRSDDEVRAACSKYWRRNLRRAERCDFEVRIGTAADLFDPVVRLYDELVDRKGFRRGLDARFYAGLQAGLGAAEQFAVCTVERDGEVDAGVIVSLLGDTAIPVSLATRTDGLRSYAAYRLQWSAIALARERGLSWYDLGGIAPESNPGVYNFKRGLRGLDLSAPGPFETMPTALRSVLTRGAEHVRRRLVPTAPLPGRRAA